MIKKYYMDLPNTKIETFIKYSEKVAKIFKHLIRGAHTETNPRLHLPGKPYPYLHWYADNPYDDYIYYGHHRDLKNSTWTRFSLDSIEIGEL